MPTACFVSQHIQICGMLLQLAGSCKTNQKNRGKTDLFFIKLRNFSFAKNSPKKDCTTLRFVV